MADMIEFNLNILLPDGSEPMDGSAGTVDMSTDYGGSYTTVYNEPQSYYPLMTSIQFKNYIAPKGLELSSVDGAYFNEVVGLFITQLLASPKVVEFKTAWKIYILSYNANGGIVTAPSKIVAYKEQFEILDVVERTGYKLLGYNLKRSDGLWFTNTSWDGDAFFEGTGNQKYLFKVGDICSIESWLASEWGNADYDFTLYAVWEAHTNVKVHNVEVYVEKDNAYKSGISKIFVDGVWKNCLL